MNWPDLDRLTEGAASGAAANGSAAGGATATAVAPGTGEPAPLRYYAAHLTVRSLVEELDRGEIVAPDFQRRDRWPRNHASRFVETLLLDLPVPEIFLFREIETDRHLIVDGQQRLGALSAFYRGRLGDEDFALSEVDAAFAGKTYATLPADHRRSLDESLIRATIFEHYEPTADRRAVLSISKRLNGGSATLHPHEIRSRIYYGPFRDLLAEMAADRSWQRLLGTPAARPEEAEETILGFLALHNDLARYRTPRASFLDEFMGRHREWTALDDPPFAQQFRRAAAFLEQALGPGAFRVDGAVAPVLAETLMCGAAHRLETETESGPEPGASVVGACRERLIRRLQTDGLASREAEEVHSVTRRIQLARAAFAEI